MVGRRCHVRRLRLRCATRAVSTSADMDRPGVAAGRDALAVGHGVRHPRGLSVERGAVVVLRRHRSGRVVLRRGVVATSASGGRHGVHQCRRDGVHVVIGGAGGPRVGVDRDPATLARDHPAHDPVCGCERDRGPVLRDTGGRGRSGPRAVSRPRGDDCGNGVLGACTSDRVANSSPVGGRVHSRRRRSSRRRCSRLGRWNEHASPGRCTTFSPTGSRR